MLGSVILEVRSKLLSYSFIKFRFEKDKQGWIGATFTD